MMKWFSLFCFLLYTNIYSLYSQIYTPGGGDPLGYAHKIDTLDTYNIQVKYEMKFMPDTLARDNYNKITTVLNLSPQGLSFFREYNRFRGDSLVACHLENGKVRQSISNKVLEYVGNIYYDNYIILKSWPEKNVLFHREQIGIDGHFTYTENKPNFGWKIDFNQTKEIAGYTCHAAKGSYAGRDYQAWFTTDIPISDGPWKFCGLPGLILEVYSLDEEYIYTCMSIRNAEGPLYVLGMDSNLKTTRERFLKAKKKYKVNPAAALAAMSDKIQSNVNLKNRADVPYNPQEKY